MTPKTNYKVLANLDYMGAYSLDDGLDSYIELNAILKSVKQVEVPDPQGKRKLCLVGYTDQPKPFIMNATAQKVVTLITHSRYVEDWVNVPIRFYVQRNVKAFGEILDALRIKAQPSAVKIDYTPQQSQLKACKTLDELQKAFTGLTADQQRGCVAVKDEMKVNLALVEAINTPKQSELI